MSKYKEHLIYLKVKPMSWFEENAYKEGESGEMHYWDSEQEYSDWDNNKANFLSAIREQDIRTGLYTVDSLQKRASISWAVERMLTLENDPEYFI